MSLEAEQAIARIELLCAFWDSISKGETSTTRQIRAAIKGPTCLLDQAEPGEQCAVSGCAYRIHPIEVNPEYDGFPSPDDCVNKPRVWPRA